MVFVENRLNIWLKNAERKFGNRFDYRKAKEFFQTNRHPKVPITCVKHKADFQVTPFQHITYVDGGCPICRTARRAEVGKKVEWSYNRWVTSARKVHSEKFEYSKSKEHFHKLIGPKVEIVCTEHNHNFFVYPQKHLTNKSGGCKKCEKKIRNSLTKRLSPADAEEALKDKLTPLLKVKSVTFEQGSKSLVVIKCQKHGDQPGKLLSVLKRGVLCRECAGKPKLNSIEKESRPELRLTISKVEEALKDKLTPLLKVKSVTFEQGSKSLVVIECQKHGDQPCKDLSNLKKGILCRECAGKPPLTKGGLIKENEILYKMLKDKTDRNLNLSERNQKIKITWVCEKLGHEFIQNAYTLIQTEYKCPKCETHNISLGKNYPELAKEFDIKLNRCNPFEVTAGSNKPVHWICSKSSKHKWTTSPGARTGRNTNCPYCSGLKVLPEDSLKSKYPNLMKEWDWKRNTISPDSVPPYSDKKVHWICSKDPRHKFIGRVANRTNAKRKGGCPLCAGYQVDETNNLSAVYPEIAKFWHPTKNKNLKPTDVYCRSTERVWWKCENGPDHEWQGRVFDRVTRTGQCLFCLNQKVSVTNSLATKFPDIAAEWHPTKNNGDTPEATLAISGKRVWWQCLRNPEHEWRTVVATRTSGGTNCPGCLPNPKSKIEIEIAAELKIFFKDLDIFDDQIFIDGKKYMPDIKIASQNLVIEYDGWYWHKDKEEKDRKKTEILSSAGWSVIRLRETPLHHIEGSISFDPHDKKESINHLLLLLVRKNYLDEESIENYLKCETLMNNDLYISWLDDAIEGRQIFKSMRRKKVHNGVLKGI